MSLSPKRSWSILLQTVTGASCSLSLFLISGFWILTSLPAPAIVDTNNNGMSDLWEKQHNSDQLYPPTFLPIDDADGDGVSNQDESTAGTDPADGKPPDGFFQAQVIHSPAIHITGTNGPEIYSPEAFTVSWATVQGKRYILRYSPDLSAGSWTPIGDPALGNGSDIATAIAPTQVGGGMPDKLFWRVGVDDIDSDSDGFTDYEEYRKGTDPYLADRDDDGLPDEWEILHNLNPNDDGSINPENGAAGDPDGDELSNDEEYSYSGNPRDSDTDDDGLDDFSEVWICWTSVTDSDSDDDDLSDFVETQITLTNPWNPDSDFDKLTDGEEINIHGTNPLNADTDGDTLSDGWEVLHGLSALIGTGSDGVDGDPDIDGLSNHWEWQLHLHPNLNDSNSDGTPDGAEDPDKDGLANLAEINTHHTDPALHDTDSDRLPDGWELSFNLDPNDSIGMHGGQGDPDNDLLDNFNEYLNSASPRLASTDGDDGATDYEEVLLGTNPADFNDGGAGGGSPVSPEDRLAETTFKVGGDYASWRMEIQGAGPRDHRKLLAISPRYNEWEEQNHNLRHDNHYEITLHHTGSRPQDDPPWYCWEAEISSPGSLYSQSMSPAGASSTSAHDAPLSFVQVAAQNAYGLAEFSMHSGRWLVDNREGVLAGHTHSQGVNQVEGKKAELVSVSIKDNNDDQGEPSGVDATSIHADPNDPGYQDKYWIMAPSGVVPAGLPGAGADCLNDMKFVIPLNPAAPLWMTSLTASATPQQIQLNGNQEPLVSWHGTTSDTNDDTPAFLIGSNQDQVDLPIAVKTMKNRTLRISIFPIRKSTSSPSIEMPDKAILISRLHKVFAYQLNAWALEPVYKPEQVFDYDPDADGILNWPSTEHGQLMSLCVDADADLIITLIGGVAYVVGEDVALGLAPPDILPVVVSTSKPVTTPDLSNLQTISPTDYINTMMHELGHRMIGEGHPDQGGGFAPLVGTDRRWRLMASGAVRISGARLIVKREWDLAEQWLIANPDSRD